jgi:hypothetical protein
MYRKTSDRESYLKRVASHSTKPLARGVVVDIPKNVAPVEVNTTKEQYHLLIGQFSNWNPSSRRLKKEAKRGFSGVPSGLKCPALSDRKVECVCNRPERDTLALELTHDARAVIYSVIVAEMNEILLGPRHYHKRLINRLNRLLRNHFPDFPPITVQGLRVVATPGHSRSETIWNEYQKENA